MAKVLIKTTLGDITVRLYDETPQHRDNFLKLAREGFYNGTIFHRVIKNFMIQGGDPGSKDAPMDKQLGAGDVGYTIPAEFVYPKFFHKKGALAAARTGDEVNPERRSSGCQFYIVTGEVYSAGKLTQLEKQMAQQQLQNTFNNLVVENRSKILDMRKNRDNAGLMKLQEELEKQTYAKAKEMGDPKFTDEQREAYTSIGGTPFLDNNYTVFGEVESGIEVTDKIQQVKTVAGDRPAEDVKMLSVEVIEG
ncbi:MAG: peptidylprolyl isomerase [Bacteroidales bacterium]|nr:peptidylprolyl isomerase [Bacteroidales bacterium]